MAAIQKRVREFTRLFRSRLSLRIVFWMFLSLTLIEGIILVPSVERRKQEILSQVKEVSAGKVNWILMTYPDATGEELLNELKQVAGDPMMQPIILGGTVYQNNGVPVGSFGEPPTLSFADARQNSQLFQQTAQGDRFDAAWLTADPSQPYVLVLRHNAAGTQAELFRYTLRIIGIVLVISAFVTLVMMISLGPSLITPILNLRRDLARTGEAIAHDETVSQFDSSRYRRQDELGEVVSTFHHMFAQISQAISERKQAEAELRRNNEQMQQYLMQVDQVTAAAVAVENDTFDPNSLTEVANRSDELGMLARMFQHMASQVKQRENQLRQQLVELKIEVDQNKCAQEVALITKSQYFQEVQEEIANVNLDEFWS